MKALVNGVCHLCNQFRPRCAWVTMRISDAGRTEPMLLCEGCRKVYRGQYRVDARHRSGKR